MLKLRKSPEFEFIQCRMFQNLKKVEEFLIKHGFTHLKHDIQGIKLGYDGSIEFNDGDDYNPKTYYVSQNSYILAPIKNKKLDSYFPKKNIYIIPEKIFLSEFVET